MNVCVVRIIYVLSHLFVCRAIEKHKKNQIAEITIIPTTTNTISSSSPSSSIKCVSPNVVASGNNSYVVFEAIYYDNGTNGIQNHSNQLVVAKVKNSHVTNDTTTATKNETNVAAAAPILVTTSVSTPLASVLHCNNTSSSTSASSSTSSSTLLHNGTLVKKPGIILLTQASLSKLLSANDLNVINNNSNINTTNHAHSHQHDNIIRSKCNFAITNTTNSNPTQNNNQLTSVLMINSTSTIETTAGIVTLTSSSTGSMQSAANRDATNENGKNSNQQVN